MLIWHGTNIIFFVNMADVLPAGMFIILHFSRAHYTKLHKTGRLDFSLREHEGEEKTLQGEFQQFHRDMFPQKCVVSSHHLKKNAFEVCLCY